MDDTATLQRRRLLSGVAGLAVTGALAGCTGDNGTDDDGADDPGGDGGADNTGDDDGTSAGDDSDDGSGVDSDENTTDDTGSGGDDGGSDDDGADTPTDGEGETPDPDELDLSEANVVGVEFEQRSGSYRFDVALHHDDDGEDGYANWWQVERRDGSQLGRRELLHAHSQQPFTRSETIDVPGDAGCVVVRGHDQTHGYGGVAMLVDLDSGAMRAVEQGAERQSFESADCP